MYLHILLACGSPRGLWKPLLPHDSDNSEKTSPRVAWPWPCTVKAGENRWRCVYKLGISSYGFFLTHIATRTYAICIVKVSLCITNNKSKEYIESCIEVNPRHGKSTVAFQYRGPLESKMWSSKMWSSPSTFQWNIAI